jgi:membrane protease subunit (stomatin/prohibitin family)
MGFFDWLKGQFIDVIEWLDDSHDTIVYRFQRQGNEIKYGAKLIVRPGQVAIFVNEGQIADTFEPGTYVLETRNLPILTSLQHWDHGFHSPFKAEVYFVSTARFTNLKWGTRGEVLIPDSQFGMVPIKAYGTFEIRVKDPKKLLKEVVGTDGLFTTDEIKGQLANLIVSNLPKAIGELGISIPQLALHYGELGERLRQYLQPIFESYGLSLEKLVIENVSLPDQIMEAIKDRVSQNIIGDMDNYIKYKTAQGLEKGGSGGNSFIEMGIGMGLGGKFAQTFGSGAGGAPSGGGVSTSSAPTGGQAHSSSSPQTSQTPPPPPPSEKFFVALEGEAKGPFTFPQLLKMVEEGRVTPQTYLWKKGLENWKRAKELLPDLFSQTPPPPPPHS